MSEREQNKPLGPLGRGIRCDEWESLIADALDGTLSTADAAAFTRHQNECPLCAQMLKETQQGKAWMEYLTAEPEVPADLLHKILARTTGAQQPGAVAPAMSLPARPTWRRVGLPAVRQIFEPRLMMTVAMAFFSIALTLNLAGIKVTDPVTGRMISTHVINQDSTESFQWNRQMRQVLIDQQDWGS